VSRPMDRTCRNKKETESVLDGRRLHPTSALPGTHDPRHIVPGWAPRGPAFREEVFDRHGRRVRPRNAWMRISDPWPTQL
jgi:hypothetical protein